ncbi:MAG TPA: FadR/GntR family transcriptional regulator [Trebonia sp.]
MPVRQTERTTLSGRVIGELERLIDSGEWQLGQKIPAEPELMASLGVSRNTVREAVRALVHEGLLDARPGDGTYVTATDGLGAALARRFRQGKALEIIEVRRMIERDAAGLAAARRSERDLDTLRELFRAQQAALSAGDRDAYLVAELAFHAAVVDAAHNALLSQLYAQMTASIRESIRFGADASSKHTEDAEHAERTAHATLHDALLTAIVAQDAPGAEAAATRHLASVEALIILEPEP